jgi:hypothetical protein
MTQWRTEFRRTMNRAEAEANSRALDSLLNYETVRGAQGRGCGAWGSGPDHNWLHVGAGQPSGDGCWTSRQHVKSVARGLP